MDKAKRAHHCRKSLYDGHGLRPFAHPTFAQRQILVRDTKGNEDRVTMLPDSLMRPLQQHLQKVRRLHQLDLGQGYGSVYLPFALERIL